MLSIVVAAYNEERRLGRSLQAIGKYLARHRLAHEIIVVDDGSNDGTARLVTELQAVVPNLRLISYATNRGKGYALRTGVLASSGDYVLISDADLSTPITELGRLLPLLTHEKCAVAIGSRALALSRIIRKQPWWRQGMGKIFNRIVKLLVLDDFHDTQCGFKLFAGDIARELFGKAKVERFAFDVEILALAKQAGYRIQEVPVRWRNAPGSKVNPLIDSPQMLFDLCRIRWRLGSAHSPAAPAARAERHPLVQPAPVRALNKPLR